MRVYAVFDVLCRGVPGIKDIQSVAQTAAKSRCFSAHPASTQELLAYDAGPPAALTARLIWILLDYSPVQSF